MVGLGDIVIPDMISGMAYFVFYNLSGLRFFEDELCKLWVIFHKIEYNWLRNSSLIHFSWLGNVYPNVDD